MDDELVKEIDPDLGNFILNKIDEIICKYYDPGLDEEEIKKLSSELGRYYRYINRARYGAKDLQTVNPPAIVILVRICEIMNCNLEEAKKMSKRDIDQIFLMEEQKALCKEPSLIGLPDGKQQQPGVKRGTETTIYSGNSINKYVS
jgi:hypothetical protein